MSSYGALEESHQTAAPSAQGPEERNKRGVCGVWGGDAPAAYGASQARGLIVAIATGLGHSNAGSEPRLRPTPQLTATLDR